MPQQNNYNDNVAVEGTVAEEGEGLGLAGGVDVVVGGDEGGGGERGNRLASSYKMIKNLKYFFSWPKKGLVQ